MSRSYVVEALVLGVCLILGLVGLGHVAGEGFVRAKEFERTVTVKGLAEREVGADIAIWPIQFVVANNDIKALVSELDRVSRSVTDFLEAAGFDETSVTVNPPAIVDQHANGNRQAAYRYSSNQTITVYTGDVDRVRSAQLRLLELGKQGVVIGGNRYGSQTEYLYNGLNELKPAMVEEATRKAREVAEKFAADSGSKLGKIKRASQGQFSINNRDSNNPHIKKVRVVSTVVYFLGD